MTDVHWVGASVTGRAHLRVGGENEDRWLGWSGGKGSAVVVSDGMGSRPHAAESAQAACEAVVAVLRRTSTPQMPQDTLPSAIEAEWAQRLVHLPPSAVGATCLFSWAPKDGPAILGQLGDGCVIWSTGAGVTRLVPAKSSWANETRSLGDGGVWRLEALRGNDRQILLASDGVADDLEPGSESEFWRLVTDCVSRMGPSAAQDAIHRGLVDWPNATSADDRTLVVHLP